MQDMRFNQPTPFKPEPGEKTEVKTKRPVFNNRIFLFVLIILAIICIVFFLPTLKQKINFSGEDMSNTNAINSSDYYAIFLDNSQVYFGKIVSKSENEIKLIGVYYLQANGNGTIGTNTDQKFTLVKLGQEVHGPTDELNINMDHVVFYEKLRKDSRLVESIYNRNN
jgi:hypothetical protein